MCILNLFKCSRVTLYCIEYEAAKKFIEQSIVLSNCFLTRVKYLVFIYETTAYLSYLRTENTYNYSLVLCIVKQQTLPSLVLEKRRRSRMTARMIEEWTMIDQIAVEFLANNEDDTSSAIDAALIVGADTNTITADAVSHLHTNSSSRNTIHHAPPPPHSNCHPPHHEFHPPPPPTKRNSNTINTIPSSPVVLGTSCTLRPSTQSHGMVITPQEKHQNTGNHHRHRDGHDYHYTHNSNTHQQHAGIEVARVGAGEAAAFAGSCHPHPPRAALRSSSSSPPRLPHPQPRRSVDDDHYYYYYKQQQQQQPSPYYHSTPPYDFHHPHNSVRGPFGTASARAASLNPNTTTPMNAVQLRLRAAAAPETKKRTTTKRRRPRRSKTVSPSSSKKKKKNFIVNYNNNYNYNYNSWLHYTHTHNSERNTKTTTKIATRRKVSDSSSSTLDGTTTTTTNGSSTPPSSTAADTKKERTAQPHHPQSNKRGTWNFTAEEDRALLKNIKEHNGNWDQIVLKMGSRRSMYALRSRLYRLNQKRTSQHYIQWNKNRKRDSTINFTEEEDRALLKTLKEQDGNWEQIVAKMDGNRSMNSLRSRLYRLNRKRDGTLNFTEEEDRALLKTIQEQEGNWDQIMAKMDGSRSMNSLQSRAYHLNQKERGRMTQRQRSGRSR